MKAPIATRTPKEVVEVLGELILSGNLARLDEIDSALVDLIFHWAKDGKRITETIDRLLNRILENSSRQRPLDSTRTTPPDYWRRIQNQIARDNDHKLWEDYVLKGGPTYAKP